MRAREGLPTEVGRPPRDDSGVSVVGRLLWVGAVAGLVIGGAAAVALTGSADLTYAVGSFSLGAMIGAVAGVTVQLLNAALLHAAREARPRLRLTPMRLLLVPLPASVASLLPWLCLTSGPGPGGPVASAWVVVLLTGAVSAVGAWVFAPWCLVPITPRAEPPSER